jgi:hypothetical protein
MVKITAFCIRAEKVLERGRDKEGNIKENEDSEGKTVI